MNGPYGLLGHVPVDVVCVVEAFSNETTRERDITLTTTLLEMLY